MHACPAQVLNMPALSPTMSQGNLAKWHVKVGDEVKPGTVSQSQLRSNDYDLASSSMAVGAAGRELAGAVRGTTDTLRPHCCFAKPPRRWGLQPSGQPDAVTLTCSHPRSRQVLADVETDKATLAFENQDDGFVARLLVAEGARDVPVGAPVAVLAEERDGVAALASFTPGQAAGPSAQAPAAPSQASAPAAQPAAPSGKAYPPHTVRRRAAAHPLRSPPTACRTARSPCLPGTSLQPRRADSARVVREPAPRVP
jgi:hypothetical protein